MKRLILILFVFSIISLSAFAKERVALVIGNGNYQVNPFSLSTLNSIPENKLI